jgi:diguanylate cyclase (GGDEF)-like protein
MMTDSGEILVFGRKAIFIDGEFWGIAVISIDFEKLMSDCDAAVDFEESQITIAPVDDNDRILFTWGSENTLNNADTQTEIYLPGQKWRIAITKDKKISEIILEYSVYLLVSIMVGIAVYVAMKYCVDKISLAKTDHLTKTLNRLEFQKQVEKKIKSKHGHFALLSIDLDKFKYINDTFGHLAGDVVLVTTAERMQRALRQGDLVSRVGGDEYMIFLKHIHNVEQANAVINRLRELCEKDIEISDQSVNVGLSVGYALTPSEGTSYKALYEVADKRMYDEKVKRGSKR